MNPLLGRWISADPLNIHAGGGDWNVYAYVSGGVLSNVDPLGLAEKDVIVVNTAPEGVSEGSYFFQADEGSGTQSFNSRAELETAAGQAGVAVFKYDPKAEHSLEKAKSIEEAKHMFDFMKEDHGSCSGMAVCGTAEKGQDTMDGELDATDGAAQVGGALSGDGMGQEGGKKDGDPAGGCSSCEGSDLKQAVVVGVKAALEASGKIAEKIAEGLKDLKKIGEALEKAKAARQWKPGPNDIDWRGTGKSASDAVNAAFKKTGVPRSEFEITKWGKDADGKSFPTEWRATNGAEVSIDTGHLKNGPNVPHVGFQTPGKRNSGGSSVGHILLDDVPVNRP